MTRGDGGQNLIGPEIGDLLGIIRSQELLAARRLDGGRQFFTSAIDFGFSKGPEETLRIWDRERVLADTVLVFREFQPDVVITRFPAADRETHGHHTSSAWMARDAMAAAGDPERFPEQLDRLMTWRPRRLLWNTSRFFYDKPEDFKPDGLLAIDVGGYSPLLGESYTELAARSRSMHKSQGFGSSGQRGEVLEFLAPVDGEAAPGDLFDGIDTTWGRIPGGTVVGDVLDRAYSEFVPEDPAGVVPRLLEARAHLTSLPPGRWTSAKLADLDRVIAACLGLYLEAASDAYAATPGDVVKINLEAANRSPVAVRLRKVAIAAAGADIPWEEDLDGRQSRKKTIEVTLPSDIQDSQPYWLREKGTLGTFRVDDPALNGLPENPPALAASFALEVAGTPIAFERPVVFKRTDPVHGERYRPFEVIPAVAVRITESVFVLPPELSSHEVVVEVRAGSAGVEGAVRLETPAGWSASPASRPFRIDAKDATTTVSFDLVPPAGASAGVIR
ncbi:MAG: PIG-L family deacetylase, partial [Chloroflexi bacterium]|nr:PIG-L family deacetylase [Chloroflexota bacterium]